MGQWIEGVTSFQKIYGLCGLKNHSVEISGDVTKAGRDGQTRKDSATKLLNRETLHFVIYTYFQTTSRGLQQMQCLPTSLDTSLTPAMKTAASSSEEKNTQ